MANRLPVAFFDVLERRDLDAEFNLRGTPLPIFANWECYIGRGQDCYHTCNDATVSNKHIHVKCIIFDEDASFNQVPPLVYVQDFSTNGTYLTRANLALGSTTEQPLSRRDGKILLAAGDRIRISPTIALQFRYDGTVDPNADRLPPAQRREAELFADRYTITNQVLGTGGYGEVFAAIHKKSNRQLACKIVDMTLWELDTPPKRPPLHDVTNISTGSPIARKNRESARRNSILNSQQFREFDILKDLDHPNIVHLEKVFWSESTIFIFQELITSGDLFSYVAYREQQLADVEVAVILYQILKGVEYLHDREIVHRDLKPDNVLVSNNPDSPLRVIITDFGGCRRLDSEEANQNMPNTKKRRMQTFSGTLEYIAPEIYAARTDDSKSYTKAIDLWSIGIIATMLLTSEVIFRTNALPIPGDPKEIMAELTAMCDLSVLDDPKSAWGAVSKRAKDFVRHLLVVDENERYDIKQALAHQWFTHKNLGGRFDAAYNRAIASWVPNKKPLRVIEALDLNRLKHMPAQHNVDVGARSRFFEGNFASSPFPQGDLYSGAITSPIKSGALPTIGEEATPEPDPPPLDQTIIPSTPQPKNPGRHEAVQDVDYGLSQMDLDAARPPSDDVMDEEVRQSGNSYDLDAPVVPSSLASFANANRQIDIADHNNVRGTANTAAKRPRDVDPDQEETCDSSLEVASEYVAKGNKVAKKLRVLR